MFIFISIWLLLGIVCGLIGQSKINADNKNIGMLDLYVAALSPIFGPLALFTPKIARKDKTDGCTDGSCEDSPKV